jgi:subtilisin family serine protease
LTALSVVFLVGLPVSTQAPGRGRIVRVNGHEAAEGEVLLKYRDDRILADHTAIETAADADVVESLNRRGARRMQSRRLRTTELLALLAQDPDVEYVEPNYVVRLLATPNDPSYPSLWGLFNNGFNPVGGGGVAGADIDAPGAWDVTTGSRSQIVAVFDTGVDYNHPDLAPNMWSAPTHFSVMVGGVSITCQAGTHGFNAITRTCDPMDDQYHGTHVAGTIGALGNNGVGVTGVNWNASIMAIKFLGSSGSGLTSDAVAGLEFVVQTDYILRSTGKADIRVLSNSWGGGGYSQSLMDAINMASGGDMLFVAAAGNNGTNNDTSPTYPASYATPNMVAVASSTSSDQRSSVSNYGATSVHLAAPGSAILSTLPGNSYGVLQGTSMATPHVSGAAMLALSACYLTTAELKSLLLGSVDHVAALSGITTTGGRLNARAAVQNCPHPKATSLTVTSDVASPQELGTTVTWTASAGGLSPGPFEYRWFLWDGTTSTTLRNWNSNPTFAWTPGTANGAYLLTVQARGPSNEGLSEVAVSKPFVIYTRATGVTLTPNLVAPQAPGTPVTWTASAAGGLAPYQYRFLIWDGAVWNEGRAWGSSSTFVWTPSIANAGYKIAVLARGSWNTGTSEVTVAQPFAIRPFVTALALTSDVAAPQATGATISFTATATGGEAPYQYQYAVWDGVAWTIARAWATSNAFAWTPGTANANYRVVVQARSGWNSGDKEMATVRSFPIQPGVTSVTVTPDKPSPRPVGDPVTFTAVPSGGVGPYQYQWRVTGGSTWTVIKSWSTSNVLTWTPAAASGSYGLQVQVRSAWNSGAAEREASVQPYPVYQGLTGVTLTPDLSSPRPGGTTIRWTAVASGTPAARYQWVLFDGTTWTNVTSWVTTNTFDWTPTGPNANFRIGVRVRSSWNTGPAEFTVIQPYAVQ